MREDPGAYSIGGGSGGISVPINGKKQRQIASLQRKLNIAFNENAVKPLGKRVAAKTSEKSQDLPSSKAPKKSNEPTKARKFATLGDYFDTLPEEGGEVVEGVMEPVARDVMEPVSRDAMEPAAEEVMAIAEDGTLVAAGGLPVAVATALEMNEDNVRVYQDLETMRQNLLWAEMGLESKAKENAILRKAIGDMEKANGDLKNANGEMERAVAIMQMASQEATKALEKSAEDLAVNAKDIAEKENTIDERDKSITELLEALQDKDNTITSSDTDKFIAILREEHEKAIAMLREEHEKAIAMLREEHEKGNAFQANMCTQLIECLHVRP